MALRTLPRRLIGSIFHVAYPVMKHTENSVRGVKRAKRLGKHAIDIDMLITSDNRIVGCHWDRPLERDGFRDPLGRIGRSVTVRHLTYTQVSRLVAGRWPRRYHIQPIERLLAECARLGVIALLEPKDDPRFATDWPWQHIAAVADDFGTTVSVRALPQNAGALPAARRAGFEAWEIA